MSISLLVQQKVAYEDILNSLDISIDFIFEFVDESPPKSPKGHSFSSGTLASLGGNNASTRLKPSIHSKKGKNKDDSAVRSPTMP